MSTITDVGASFTTKITEANLDALKQAYFKAMADCGYTRVCVDTEHFVFYWVKSNSECQIRCPFG